QVKQRALPALLIRNSGSPLMPPTAKALCTSWQVGHCTWLLYNITAAIVPVLVCVPDPIVTVLVDGSNRAPSAVASAVLKVNEIGWSFDRSAGPAPTA